MKTVDQLFSELHHEQQKLRKRLREIEPLCSTFGSVAFEFYNLEHDQYMVQEYGKKLARKGMRMKWCPKRRRLELFPII